MVFQVFKIFLDIVTPVFLVVLIGYFAGPRLKLDAGTLSKTAYFILVPCFVFNLLSNVDIPIAMATQMILYATLTYILVAIAAFFTAKLLNRSREVTAAFVIIATFGNVGNLGLSLIDFRLGPDSQTSAIIYYSTIVPLAFVICVGIASWAKGSGMKAVLSVFKTPALIAMVPALFFCGTDFEPPLFLSRVIELLAKATIPVMLLVLGVQLSGLKKFIFNIDIVTTSLLRLIVAPLIAFLLTSVFTLSHMEMSAGILYAGMPVAIIGSMIAIEYDVVPDFVTTAVLFSTLLSLLTLTILIFLV